MDKTMLQTYRSRWEAVRAVEREEQQNASLTQRWHQLNALAHMANTLALKPQADEVERVRQRWCKLKGLDLL